MDPYAHPKAHELDSITVEAYVRQQSGHEAVYHILNAATQACLGCDSSQVIRRKYLDNKIKG